MTILSFYTGSDISYYIDNDIDSYWNFTASIIQFMNFLVQEDLLAIETDFKVIIEFCWNFSLMFRYTVLCLWTPSQVHTGNSV